MEGSSVEISAARVDVGAVFEEKLAGEDLVVDGGPVEGGDVLWIAVGDGSGRLVRRFRLQEGVERGEISRLRGEVQRGERRGRRGDGEERR